MIHIHKQQLRIYFMVSCCLISFMLSACVYQPSQDTSAQVDYGTAPTLSGLSASQNPAESGSVVQLTTNYVDADSDLLSGLAAISINGGNLSSLNFRATYPSGVLTLPFSISAYSRPSDLHISLKIRDDAGNWSNAVSMKLLVRQAESESMETPPPTKNNEGL